MQRTSRSFVCVPYFLSLFLIAALGYTLTSRAVVGDSAERVPATDATSIAGADRRLSSTAADWVAYADHVVVVTVVDASDMIPDEGEVALGEGAILRTLTMTVDDTVWSSKSSTTPAPERIVWTALGWTFHDGLEVRRMMVNKYEPRLEIGRSYILAIEWESNECSESEGIWRGLGRDSALPFDTETIGIGEVEGQEQNLEEANEVARERQSEAREGGYEPALGGPTPGSWTRGVITQRLAA